jgi:hypothetical protein
VQDSIQIDLPSCQTERLSLSSGVIRCIAN